MFTPKRLWTFSFRKISLTARFSILLVLAATLPLLITLLGSYLILRPTLLSQSGAEMENDARINARSINSYLSARAQEVSFLGESSAIQRYLAGIAGTEHQALNELVAGHQLDPYYTTWTLFDAQGNLRLTYPTYPKVHGKHLVPPSALQELLSGNKLFFSNVYFDTVASIPFIDIYASVSGPNANLMGIGRATLNLTQVWNTVNNETNANTGGYAMILDSHSVCIAYTITGTLSPALFKAIAPLPASFSQQIKDEDLYGNSQSPVTVLSDPALASALQSPQGPTVFETTPRQQEASFQAARATVPTVSWTYLVFRPVNQITNPANQQELYLILLGVVAIAVAAFIGLMVSRGVTSPILHVVASLMRNSHTLKHLADVEQAMSKEQQWIVEATQKGLHSVQYYDEATRFAIERLNAISNNLLGHWGEMNLQQTKQHLEGVIISAKYIKTATYLQQESFEDLASAVRLITEVTEQFSTNATEALDSAALMEEAVEQLREAVGERVS